MKHNNENIMYLSALYITNSPDKFIAGKKYIILFKTALLSWGHCGGQIIVILNWKHCDIKDIVILSYLVENIVESLFVHEVIVILSYLVEDIMEP